GAPRAARQAFGDGEKSWREPDRVDYNKQGHKRRYGEVERHADFLSPLWEGSEGAEGDTLLRIDLRLPEHTIADYEWIEEGKPYRGWLIPAQLLNENSSITITTDWRSCGGFDPRLPRMRVQVAGIAAAGNGDFRSEISAFAGHQDVGM